MPWWSRLLCYGLLGWCIELMFTAASRFLHERNLQLRGHSYLWMLPVYALGGGLLELVHVEVAPAPAALRGLGYVVVIYVVEYVCGFAIRKGVGHSPWNYYGQTRWQLHGLIRFDYAPFWFGTGLVFELVHDLFLHVRLV